MSDNINTRELPDLTVFWEGLVNDTQIFSNHMSLALDALLKMIPDPDNNGIAAHDFVEMLIKHVDYFSNNITTEVKAIRGEAA